ncbi:MAG: helix-turn-helix transcriptional regulator [Kineosporiaceae bacterium]
MATSGQESPLAARLRHARQDAGLTQKEVAGALGVSVAGISSWESRDSAKVPDVDRLTKYAGFLAERLGIDPAELAEEFAQLREVSRRQVRRGRLDASVGPRPGPDGGIWSFDSPLPVTIVCSRMPEAVTDAVAWSRAGHPNYLRMLTMADSDAALSLYGYLCAHNPGVPVTVGTPDELRNDLLTGHLVMLGCQDWATLGGPMMDRMNIPVAVEPPGEVGTGAEFEGSIEVTGGPHAGRRFTPNVVDPLDGGAVPMLLDDVALLARGRSPLNPAATVTVCTGIFNRGTAGLVRATTDRLLAVDNHRVLADRFGAVGSAHDAFALIARVNVVDQLTPPVAFDGVLEWEWPD